MLHTITNILHPTDLAEPADEAYRAACSLTRDRLARLTILHIAPKGVVGFVDHVSELAPEDSREKLWQALRRPREEEADLMVEHLVREGDPTREILAWRGSDNATSS